MVIIIICILNYVTYKICIFLYIQYILYIITMIIYNYYTRDMINTTLYLRSFRADDFLGCELQYSSLIGREMGGNSGCQNMSRSLLATPVYN